MVLSAKKWQEIKEGHGLEGVPPELRKEMICRMCGVLYRGKLWTDHPIGLYTTMREYQVRIDRMRHNCFCRYHAEQMFGPKLD